MDTIPEPTDSGEETSLGRTLRLMREEWQAPLQKQLDAVRALHRPEKRWQPHPDAEFSCDTEEEARRFVDDDTFEEDDPDYDRITVFTICAECGGIERRALEDDDEWSYRELWPCATVRALNGGQDAR